MAEAGEASSTWYSNFRAAELKGRQERRQQERGRGNRWVTKGDFPTPAHKALEDAAPTRSSSRPANSGPFSSVGQASKEAAHPER